MVLHLSALSSRHRRRRRACKRPQRTKPYLEFLEGRCLPSTVTNLSDHDPGSLRDAIATTPAGGTVDFQPGLTGTITLTTGELDISQDLTITGPGADLITVSGNHVSRVFEIQSGTVAISGLTIANGLPGGISNDSTLTLSYCTVSGNSNSIGDGGGVLNGGTMTLSYCTVSGNTTEIDAGGIINGGTMTISNSTITGNTARGFDGGIGSNGNMTIINSTISGNTAGAGGGGILNGSGGTLSISNSTISGNSAQIGGGIRNVRQMTLFDTIIAGNTAPADTDLEDLTGGLTSQGHNLVGDGTGADHYLASDLVGTHTNPIDPMLGPLADNGGPTQTMALLPGSPAIGAGDLTDAPPWDQRGPGFPRVINGRIDIGAFEVQNTTPEDPIHGGFDAFMLPPCDDCSSPATALGFTFNFFGVRRDTVWVNNNGNLTFDSAFGSFLPGPVDGVGQPILAPFWADVYTNGNALGRVTYGRGMLDGDPAFAATWENVARYLPDGTTNYFQVVIIDHSERGFQEVQFNYLTIGWDHTESSDLAPRVGYSNAAGASGELPGSGTFDTLVDSGSQSLRLLRRYTLIVYPFPVLGGSSYYDAAANFSATDNPNGAWSYGWAPTEGSAFVLDTDTRVRDGSDNWLADQGGDFGEPLVSHNGTDHAIEVAGSVILQSGQLSFHPGPDGQFAIIRWTAPGDGLIIIATTFTGADFVGPTTTDVHILHNGVPFFDGIVDGFGPGSGPSFTGNMTVTAGDTVDFAVGFGPDGDYYYDTTGLDAVITFSPAAPEGNGPATAALFAPSNLGASQTLAPPEVAMGQLGHGNGPIGVIAVAPSLTDLSVRPGAIPLARAILIESHSLPVDGYHATAHEEGFQPTMPGFDEAKWHEGNGLALDLVLTDDRLVV